MVKTGEMGHILITKSRESWMIKSCTNVEVSEIAFAQRTTANFLKEGTVWSHPRTVYKFVSGVFCCVIDCGEMGEEERGERNIPRKFESQREEGDFEQAHAPPPQESPSNLCSSSLSAFQVQCQIKFSSLFDTQICTVEGGSLALLLLRAKIYTQAARVQIYLLAV